MATKKKIASSTKTESTEEVKTGLSEKEMAYFSALVGAENAMDISLTVEGDALPIVSVVDTGSYLLNDALSCNGLPNGRLIQYYGGPGCHRKGQGILMYDGSIKNVEDIQIGDRLMGMDSTPRNVLSLCNGYEKMYEIQPNKGKSWVVNENHILTLNKTAKKISGKYKKIPDQIMRQSIRAFYKLSDARNDSRTND